MFDEDATYDGWKMQVLLLLTGPDKFFKSGEEAMEGADHELLNELWNSKHPQSNAAKAYVIRKSGLVGMDPRLRDLIDRLCQSGRIQLSASEFEELVDMVEGLQSTADEMGTLLMGIVEKPTELNLIPHMVRELIRKLQDGEVGADETT